MTVLGAVIVTDVVVVLPVTVLSKYCVVVLLTTARGA